MTLTWMESARLPSWYIDSELFLLSSSFFKAYLANKIRSSHWSVAKITPHVIDDDDHHDEHDFIHLILLFKKGIYLPLQIFCNLTIRIIVTSLTVIMIMMLMMMMMMIMMMMSPLLALSLQRLKRLLQLLLRNLLQVRQLLNLSRIITIKIRMMIRILGTCELRTFPG